MSATKEKRNLLVWLIAVTSLILLMTAKQALAARPLEDVKGLFDKVIGILHNPAYQASEQKSKRLQLIEQAILGHFDYDEMAKLSLGQTWDTLNQAQQAEFVEVFKDLLKSSYANRIDELTKTEVAYGKETENEDSAEVFTTIIRANDKIPVNFRLLHKPQGWLIYDLEIEGVSMVGNFNSLLSRTLKVMSYAKLIKCMHEKAKENCLIR
jgi:phospholipid transport system substrate-binding protein